MTAQYGLMVFDRNGNVTDINMRSALTIEGVLILGNTRTGCVELDVLFPLREHFSGIFMMPVFHAFAANAPVEHAVSIYWDKGKLVWNVPYQADTMYSGMPWAGGAFAGRQFYYGYFNNG